MEIMVNYFQNESEKSDVPGEKKPESITLFPRSFPISGSISLWKKAAFSVYGLHLKIYLIINFPFLFQFVGFNSCYLKSKCFNYDTWFFFF